MQTQTRIDLCREVFAALDKTLAWRSDATYQHPATAYCSQEWLAREKSLLFREYPCVAEALRHSDPFHDVNHRLPHATEDNFHASVLHAFDEVFQFGHRNGVRVAQALQA